MPSVSDLERLAKNDIIPLTSGKTTLTRAEIWKSAIDRRPDALYWDADLYIWNYTTGGTFSLTEKSWTTLYNLEALNMLSTWCAMLQAGASTRAILSELLLQQYSIASQSGDGSVPYLCRMLVEDCLTMARQEWKETKAGQMKRPQATLHTDYLSTKIAPTSKTQAAALAAGLASLPAPVDSGGLALAAGGVLAAGAAGGLVVVALNVGCSILSPMRQRPMLRVVPRWRERPPLGKHATIGQFDILDPSTWFDSTSTDTSSTDGGGNSLLSGGGGVSGTSTLSDNGGQTIDSNGNITSGGGGGGGGTTVSPSPSQSNTSPPAVLPTSMAMDWTPWIWGGIAAVAIGGIALVAMKGRKKNPGRRYRRKSGSRSRKRR